MGGSLRRANDWLGFELDVTVTDAEFTDDDPVGDLIPGSIEDTVAAAINLGDPDRLSGSLRWRYFADAPLIEDGSVNWASASSLNGRVAYRFGEGLSTGHGDSLIDSTGVAVYDRTRPAMPEHLTYSLR